jgi:CheY-like chemotaxis protein
LPIVIVAEDDEVHRREIGEVLREDGYRVIEVANGQEALDRLLWDREIQQPAMVLLDLSMPIMTGWELLMVRHGYLRLKQFPVVLISGSDPQLDPERHGAVAGVLRKPYDLDALLDMVDGVLRAATDPRLAD